MCVHVYACVCIYMLKERSCETNSLTMKIDKGYRYILLIPHTHNIIVCGERKTVEGGRTMQLHVYLWIDTDIGVDTLHS